MHLLGDHTAVLRIVGLLDAARPVLQQRLIEELRPLVQHRRLLAREIDEAPAFVSLVRLVVVTIAHRLVEVDHAADELRLEDADCAEIEQVQSVIGAHLVIAQMRVAV